MNKRIFKIPIDETDSQEFVDVVNSLSTSLTIKEGTNEISITKIKNWFDHKWLNYSGFGVIPFDSGGLFEIDAAKEPKWRDKITVPPFNPNRIIWRKSYFLHEHNDKFLKKLHNFQSSSSNLQNRILKKSEKGLFVWYSSNSKVNKRGSLMIYSTDFTEVKTFYASFEEKDLWSLNKTKGISRRELKVHLNT